MLATILGILSEKNIIFIHIMNALHVCQALACNPQIE